MNIIARIQQDVKTILSNSGEFATPVIFSVTGGSMVTTVTCNALAMKHNLVWDGNTGNRVNGRNTRVTVSELALTALSYPVRNTSNHVSLMNHLVTWTDISGLQATYVIREQYPDEVTGLILCRLGDYGAVTPPGRLIVGWIVSRFDVVLVNTVDPLVKQTLANGDIINVQYSINVDGTLTIPYLVGYNVLTPFVIDNSVLQDEPFTSSTGTFDNSAYGGFIEGNIISFNASIPVWQS